MKQTTFDLICVSIGCLLGSLFYGYYNHVTNGSLVFSAIADTWFGIWVAYFVVRMRNKEIK